jgi:hypothetical protein
MEPSNRRSRLVTVTGVTTARIAAVGDLNNDGKPDLVYIGGDEYGTSAGVFLNIACTTGPRLGASYRDSSVVLRWPYPSTGYVLESSPNLDPETWVPTPSELPTTTNGHWEFISPTLGNRTYFRLHKR